VDSWWRRLVDAGYESDGEPGLRPQYSASYYGSFVRDPDGNSVEAVHHDQSQPSGIDHLWFRTGDVAAARAFYEPIAPAVALRPVRDALDRVRFRGDGGSFTFVDDAGEPTEAYVAFAAPDKRASTFHADALVAATATTGRRSRPQYSDAYYGAFVLDPDGHNIEAVWLSDRR
jgi:predicted lactoylglutathione lyase